jgi:hypothetical protein
MYTPFHEVTGAMRADEVSRYNRQMLPADCVPHDISPADLYQFVFGLDDRLTTIYDRIPLRRPEVAS